jgi:hypothetical protein
LAIFKDRQDSNNWERELKCVRQSRPANQNDLTVLEPKKLLVAMGKAAVREPTPRTVLFVLPLNAQPPKTGVKP